jgi:glycerol-3-phosphate cytidylyltransferase
LNQFDSILKNILKTEKKIYKKYSKSRSDSTFLYNKSMKNKVFVPGVFDFLHKGHTNLIEYAIDNYDEVYIGLINDKGLKLKNKKTYFSFQQRRNFIKNEFQNVKIIKTDSTKEHYEKILSSNNIKNILFGLDHKGSEKSEYLSKNFNVEIIERTKNISSTGLRNEISELNKKQLKVLQRALSIQRIILKDFKLINEEFTSNGIN